MTDRRTPGRSPVRGSHERDLEYGTPSGVHSNSGPPTRTTGGDSVTVRQWSDVVKDPRRSVERNCQKRDQSGGRTTDKTTEFVSK